MGGVPKPCPLSWSAGGMERAFLGFWFSFSSEDSCVAVQGVCYSREKCDMFRPDKPSYGCWKPIQRPGEDFLLTVRSAEGKKGGPIWLRSRSPPGANVQLRTPPDIQDVVEEDELVEVLNREMTNLLKGEPRVCWTPAEGRAGWWQRSAGTGEALRVTGAAWPL